MFFVILVLNFENVNAVPDNKFFSLMGIDKSSFQQLLIICNDNDRNSYRSLENCLAILLIKLRTGMTNDIIASLFGTDDSTVGRYISSGREILMKKFVPKFLGKTTSNKLTIYCL